MRSEPAVRPACTRHPVGSAPPAGSTRPVGVGRGRCAATSFARVTGMPENYTDPSGNTEAFRAFNQTPEATPQAESPSRLPLIIGAAVVVVLLVALVAWLA